MHIGDLVDVGCVDFSTKVRVKIGDAEITDFPSHGKVGFVMKCNHLDGQARIETYSKLLEPNPLGGWIFTF